MVVIGMLGLMAIIWFVVQGSSIDYVATVDDEVSRLELELSKIEEEVAAGTLTPAEATAAKQKIYARLGTIDESVESSQKGELSDVQRVMLLDGLDRLKDVLVKYQATLTAVDEAESALPVNERSGDTKPLPAAIADTIEVVEDYVVDEVDQYTPDEPDETEAEVEDETASSSDSVVDENDNEDNSSEDLGNDTEAEEVSATTATN